MNLDIIISVAQQGLGIASKLLHSNAKKAKKAGNIKDYKKFENLADAFDAANTGVEKYYENTLDNDDEVDKDEG